MCLAPEAGLPGARAVYAMPSSAEESDNFHSQPRVVETERWPTLDLTQGYERYYKMFGDIRCILQNVWLLSVLLAYEDEDHVIPTVPGDTANYGYQLMSAVRHRRRNNPSAFSLRGRNGEPTNDPTMVSEVYREHYACLCSALASSSHPLLSRRCYEQPLTDLVFTVEDIGQLLHKINPFCALGPHEVHPRILEETSSTLANHLHMVFRQSLDEGCLHFAWKETFVTPIYKTSDRLSPGSCRPISLTSVLCKVMERILKQPVLDHLNSSNLISPAQHGFLPNRS
ncbi:hypothetical protein T265_11599 [Opisthorchis viverrini]|uniref:Reverse transcriptase domain-containing protein n=1 Tax=Opisthorchis viverrini TaxID=6198 RepID=A0A074Z8Z6_OPIVI|nr:hypothetical protein T265_11599 [Opisthorchis viverrini]KER19695.1 hypothetical protein T265_11599 [Opisthorchis viverrini]